MFPKPTSHIKQYFHWLFVIAPLISTGVALVLGADERLVEFTFIIGSVVVNVVIIWLTLSFDKNSEQSLVRTFLTDDLLPNKSGGPLEFQAQLVIIEDEAAQGSFVHKLKRQFGSKRDREETQNLILIPFACSSSEADARKLPLKLEGAHAVLVSRTQELEDKPWIYTSLDDWAYKRSDVPILFTELAPEHRKSVIPDKYFSVPSDPKTIPWRLMQRATERGFEWRRVSRFNRMMATNGLILLVLSLCLGFFLLSRQDKEHNAALAKLSGEHNAALAKLSGEQQTALTDIFQGMANRAKLDYQQQSPNPRDGDFSVSYWLRYKGELRQLVATDLKKTYMKMADNKASVIGCAFAHNTAITQWVASDPKHIKVWEKDNKRHDDPECTYVPESAAPPQQLVCSSYNYTTPPEYELTVGICVVARRSKIIIGNDNKHREFLRTRARDLFESSFELIKTGKLIPMTK